MANHKNKQKEREVLKQATVSNPSSGTLEYNLDGRVTYRTQCLRQMSQHQPKRPAHFDDDYDSPKRQRKPDVASGDVRDVRRENGQNQGQSRRRSRSPSYERDRKYGERDRRERNRDMLRDDRRRRSSLHRQSPPRGLDRSPRRDHSRSRRDRSRERTRYDDNRRDRTRVHTPPQSSKEPIIGSAVSQPHQKNSAEAEKDTIKMEVDSVRNADDEFTVEMRRIMGFGSFRSTKNTKVPGNDKLYGVRKEKKTEYRQYMNRVGGFNRPLSPSRS